jgi:heme O synthase-like polyprenyltransferase
VKTSLVRHRDALAIGFALVIAAFVAVDIVEDKWLAVIIALGIAFYLILYVMAKRENTNKR